MLNLRLEYQGEGRFRALNKLDYDLCCEKLQNGDRLRAKVGRQRSVRQNDYFHALIEAAWENQRGGPRLPTWKHLKSWLLIKAGHCDVKEFSAGAMTPAVAAYLRQQFDTVEFTHDSRRIYMKTAKSVSFRNVDAETMTRIMDAVIATICDEILPGSRPDDLRRQAEAMAA